MYKILVTGAAGYIGSRLCRRLLTDWPFIQNKIYAVDNFTYNNQHSLIDLLSNPNFHFIRDDVTKPSAKLIDLYEQADVIYPLAALVGAPICEEHVDKAWEVNYRSIQKMLNHVNPSSRIIFPDTNSGYGTQESNTTLCTEETPMEPISEYGKSKYAAEQAILSRHKNSVVMRLATVFGVSPRMRFDLMVNDFIRQAYYHRKLKIFDGNAARNFVGLPDLVEGFVHAIDIEPGVYNFGNDECNMTKIELAHTIAREFVDCKISDIDGEDPDKRNYIVSSDKFKATGFEWIFGIKQGVSQCRKLCEMCDWSDTIKMGNV